MSEMELLGLNEDESKVYKILLVSGQLSSGELRFAASLNSERCSAALEGLATKKLVRTVPGLDERYAGLLPIGNLREEIENSISLIDILSTQVRKDGENVVQELQTDLNSKVEEVSAMALAKKGEVSNLLADLEKSLTEKQQVTGNTLQTTIAENQEQLKQHTNNAIINAEEKVDAQRSISNEMLTGKKAEITSNNEAAKQSIGKIKSDLDSQVQTSDLSSLDGSAETLKVNLDEHKDSVSNLMNENAEKSNQASRELNGSITSNLDVLKRVGEQYRSNVTTIAQTLSGQVENFNSNAKQQSAQISDSLSKAQQDTIAKVQTLKSEKVSHDASISSDISDLFAKSNEVKESMQTVFSKNVDSLEKKITELLQTTVTSLKSEIETSVLKLKDDEKSSYGQILAQLESKNTNYNTVLDGSLGQLNQINEDLQTLTTSLGNTLDEGLKQTQSEVTQFTTNHDVEFETNFTNVLIEISTKMETRVELLNSSIKEVNNTIISQLDNTLLAFKAKLSEDLTRIKQAVNDVYEDSVIRYNRALENAGNALLTHADGLSETSTSSVTALEQDLANIETGLKNSIGESVGTVQTQLSDMINGIQGNFNEYLSSSFSSIKMQGEGLQGIADDAITQSETLIATATTSQITAIRDALDKYNKQYDETTKKVKEPTAALAKILGTIENDISGTNTPTVNTTYVVGQESITEFMRDMTSRVKSKATILVPSITMVDVPSILALKRTAQVTIISYIDEGANQKWIDEIYTSEANVTLRNLSKSTNLPDFIGFEREGEEILLGTIDEGNNDYVAIVSGSEYFVKTLGNIVIADYARGRSTPIKKL